MNSLLITPQLCRKYNACKEGLYLMDKYFLNGFTVEQVYKKEVKHVPIDFVNWGYHNLPFTDEDKKMYLEYAQIVDSNSFYNCFDILKCHLISDSKFCQFSSYVFKSNHIDESNYVLNSKDVHDSIYVCNSSLIFQSKEIIDSKDIHLSQTVATSTNVKSSFGIAFCENIEKSQFLVNCFNVKNSLLSSELSDCSNKIFCYDLDSNDTPMIFNQEVTQSHFNAIFKLLINLLQERTFKCMASFNKESFEKGTPITPTVFPMVTTFYQTFKDDIDFLE